MKRTIIIAEAGVNHNGNMALAKQLVDVAAEAGADYVKFQTFRTENLVSKKTTLAEYQKKNLGKDNGDQFDMLKTLELTEADHLELIDYCRKRGIRFLSTAFDMESLEFLHSLCLDYWKIPSGEITNYPYLKAIAGYGGKVIMSTGMCSISDISDAIDVLIRFGIKREDISLLHCNTEYPTPLQDVNLYAMVEMKREFDMATGYSDHTKGIEIPVAAVALGATIIEKHFTLNRNMSGPDHAASLEPDELKTMVTYIRNVEKALGCAFKTVTESEQKNIRIARKSIVASVNISEGEAFSEQNLC
ncbi:MAG: N-acetylneuraminate synthase, partial [Muribaculaceae bacterium]|nr:N-acetylneuraminate synthase [Muribaculaceae bacterium]